MFIVSVLLEELALDRGPAQPQVPYLGISLLALPGVGPGAATLCKL